MKLLKLKDLVNNCPCSYGDDIGKYDNLVPVVKVSNVNGEGYFKNNFEKRSFPSKKLDKLLAQEGDLLVVKSSGSKLNILSGKTAIVNRKLSNNIVPSNFLLRLSPRKDKVFPKYLWYLLNSQFSRNYVKTIVGATTYPNLKWDLYSKHPVPYVDICEQKSIVQKLDTANSFRQKRKEQLVLLDDYLKSVFLEMFGDPVINPKRWPVKKLGRVGDLDRGISKNRPRNAPELLNGPYPLIQTGEVSNSGGYIKGFKYTYSELGLMQSKIWPIGTLCITIAANIAKTGILTFEACFPDSVVGFTPNNLVRTEYIQWWMVFLQKILEEKAPKSAQKNINLEILRGLDIPVPPIELQNKFVLIVEKVEKTKQKMCTSLEEMNNHFNALMQRYFK